MFYVKALLFFVAISIGDLSDNTEHTTEGCTCETVSGRISFAGFIWKAPSGRLSPFNFIMIRFWQTYLNASSSGLCQQGPVSILCIAGCLRVLHLAHCLYLTGSILHAQFGTLCMLGFTWCFMWKALSCTCICQAVPTRLCMCAFYLLVFVKAGCIWKLHLRVSFLW